MTAQLAVPETLSTFRAPWSFKTLVRPTNSTSQKQRPVTGSYSIPCLLHRFAVQGPILILGLQVHRRSSRPASTAGLTVSAAIAALALCNTLRVPQLAWVFGLILLLFRIPSFLLFALLLPCPQIKDERRVAPVAALASAKPTPRRSVGTSGQEPVSGCVARQKAFCCLLSFLCILGV